MNKRLLLVFGLLLAFGGGAWLAINWYTEREASRPAFSDQEFAKAFARLHPVEAQAADVVAERLNDARGEWTFLIPLKGWSSQDLEGRIIYDPAADAAFVARLKEKLDDPGRVREVGLHLYTPEFARVAVDEFVRLYAGTPARAVAQ